MSRLAAWANVQPTPLGMVASVGRYREAASFPTRSMQSMDCWRPGSPHSKVGLDEHCHQQAKPGWNSRIGTRNRLPTRGRWRNPGQVGFSLHALWVLCG